MLDAWSVATILAKWAVYASALVAAGGGWFALARPVLPAMVWRSFVRVTALAAVFGILATLVRFAVQAGYLIDDGWHGTIDPAMLALVAEGPLGTASAVRVAGLGLVAVLILPGRSSVRVASAGALLVAVSFALTGHASEAASGAARAGVMALIVVHLAAASFWVGALWPLYRLAGEPGERPATASAAERFGRQAAWTVAALAIAGTALAWVLLGSFGALFTADYGRTLLVKLGLVCALLGLGALNKWRLVPALGGVDAVDADRASTMLRRSIAIEAVLVVFVLLVTAVLTGATVLPAV